MLRLSPTHTLGAHWFAAILTALFCACGESGGPSGSGAGGDTSTASAGSGMTGTDCTFPNDASICGCGNACVGDPNSPSYGLCEICGPNGSGCSSDDIWCCADEHCPSGLLCSTLSSSPSIGYHVCVADLSPCSTTSDCFSGEVCTGGYCRDAQ